MMLTHLASRFYNMPLLIQRAKLDVILSVLGPRIGWTNAGSPHIPEVDAVLPVSRPSAGTAPPGIAVIPVHGTLVKRALGIEAASGLMSYGEIAASLAQALSDPAVSGILLDVDSPGGETSGVFELSRKVREASGIKPVWAVGNDSAFSAAYAIASSAQRLIVTETAGVGSVGVIALHVDQSVKDAQDGYRYTAITAGEHKNDFSPHEPLSDAARVALQAEVDRLYAIFVEHVAAMRGLSVEAVRDSEAGLYFGSLGLDAGFADALGTFDSTLAEFSSTLSSRNRPPTARGNSRSRAVQNEVKTMTEPLIEAPDVVLIPAEHAALQVAEARQEAAQSAQAIVEMCLIAGCPEKAAEFLAAGKAEAEVRRILIEARAAQSERSEIRSTILADAGTEDLSRPERSPMVAAVQKLHPKE